MHLSLGTAILLVFILWIVAYVLPVDGKIKTLLQWIIVTVFLFWALQLAGVL